MLGIFRQPIILDFKEFVLQSWLIVTVEDDQDYQILRPEGEYQPYVIDETPRTSEL